MFSSVPQVLLDQFISCSCMPIAANEIITQRLNISYINYNCLTNGSGFLLVISPYKLTYFY